MTAVHPDELLLALSDASEIGLVLIGGDGCIVLWNAWIAKASGIDAARALGARLAAVFPEVAGTRIETSVEQALSAGMSAVL